MVWFSSCDYRYLKSRRSPIQASAQYPDQEGSFPDSNPSAPFPQDTNLCFVALQLGDDDSEEGALERHTVVEQVLARARVGYKSLDAASQFHHCIAIGHLPYRVHLVESEGAKATDGVPAGKRAREAAQWAPRPALHTITTRHYPSPPVPTNSRHFRGRVR